MEFHLKVKDVRAELLLSIRCSKHSCSSQLDELKLFVQIIKQWNMSLAHYFLKAISFIFQLAAFKCLCKSLPSRFTHGKLRPSVTIKTFPTLGWNSDDGNLRSRKTATAQRFPSVPTSQGRQAWMEWNLYDAREKSKTKQTSSGILFIHSRFREPLVVNTVAQCCRLILNQQRQSH